MPEIEYLKDDKNLRGKPIKKGAREHVTRKRAKELEDKKIAVVVGSESNRNTQERTSIINDATSKSASKKKGD